MQSSYFKNTLVYIFENRSWGAGGFVINKTIPKLYPQDLLLMDNDSKLLLGGPLAKDKTFLIYAKNNHWYHESSNMAIQSFMEEPNAPYCFVKGLCFWSKNQIDDQILDNQWVCVDNHSDILRVPANNRYQYALAMLGIHSYNFAYEAGTA